MVGGDGRPGSARSAPPASGQGEAHLHLVAAIADLVACLVLAIPRERDDAALQLLVEERAHHRPRRVVTRTESTAERDSVSEKRAIAASQSQPGEKALACVKSALTTRGGSDLRLRDRERHARADQQAEDEQGADDALEPQHARSLRRAEQALRRSRRPPQGSQLVVGGAAAAVARASGRSRRCARIITLRAVCSAETNSITSVR